MMNGLIVLLLAALGTGAAAQESSRPDGPATRAAELQARREAKARALTPPRRSGVERVLFRMEDDLLVERWLNPPRGVYARVGGIGEGAGFGLGPGYRYSTGRYDLRVSAAASTKAYVLGEAVLTLPGAVKDGPVVELYGRWRDFPEEDFFGIGPRSERNARSDYALRDKLGRVSAGVRKGRFLAAVGTGYLDPSVGEGTDPRMPSTATIFTSDEAPGLEAQPAFAFVEPFVEFSTADPPLNPVRGASVRWSLSRYADRDFDRYSFNTTDLDARAYVPFFQRTHSIALRARVVASDPDDGHEVPFYLMPTLGGAYSLRGFRTFRFRDRALALAQAEYRWRVNEFVTGALFYDAGAVARSLGDLGRLEHDYGIGLRAGSRAGVAFRFDVAFGSGEGTRLLLRFNNAF